MKESRKIELLAPARDVECGIEAIRHGADAVYIGADRFGARSAAGNSIERITELVDYAHLFGTRVYVTLNTILKDEELAEAEKMVWDLYRIGVDALIIQDMAFLQLKMPPIPLHASTQMDNRTVDKVRFLADAGFRQVVLARELSLSEITAIHRRCDVPLEVFVHGALCVSYSGQCYASEYCFHRSANRGECAQFCRLSFDLIDADGNQLVRKKHLLSLKDMNRSQDLRALLDAGVSSFKIEGRLKDVTYVKNVTAYYRRALDEIITGNPDYSRASSGRSEYMFTPLLEKSFNRGFTDYYLYERKKSVTSFDTPKSLGEEVGYVKEIRGSYFTVAGVAAFHNGDGLCFIDKQGTLRGFRVNRVEDNRLFPMEMPPLEPKMTLYRNFDHSFDKQLNRPSAERKLDVDICFSESEAGFILEMIDEDQNRLACSFDYPHEEARTPQVENIKKLLSKMGNTPFRIRQVDVNFSKEWFIPSSVATEWRRQITDDLLRNRHHKYHREESVIQPTKSCYPLDTLTYLGNVNNEKARSYYSEHGVKQIDRSFELQHPEHAVLMFCKHCIRFSLGWCPKNGGKEMRYKEPLFLCLPDGRKFRLGFDCKNCQMKVYAPE